MSAIIRLGFDKYMQGCSKHKFPLRSCNRSSRFLLIYYYRQRFLKQNIVSINVLDVFKDKTLTITRKLSSHINVHNKYF